jgi:beta-glucanase (GH16 family)
MKPFPATTLHETFHTYAVNWTSESIVWLIDGSPMRTLNFAEANGGNNFPQTPMNVRIGIWAGGDESNSPGTIEWACGKTDYSKAPYTMVIESVKITNYSPGKEYKYGDKSGSFKSIQTIAGDCVKPGDTIPLPVSSVLPLPGSTETPQSTPGGFYPNIPSSSVFYSIAPSQSTSDTCSDSTVTVTVTKGSNVPVPPPQTTVIRQTSTAAITVTSISSSSSQDISSSTPLAPSSSLTASGTSSITAPSTNGTKTSTATPPPFTGAATRLDGVKLHPSYFLGLLAGLFML